MTILPRTRSSTDIPNLRAFAHYQMTGSARVRLTFNDNGTVRIAVLAGPFNYVTIDLDNPELEFIDEVQMENTTVPASGSRR